MEIVAMASGSKEDVAKPSWAVGPKEDVVQALMETLVDPILPLRVSNIPHPEDVQKYVAKQMHAVVLLYNYYHRKQKPDLEFLDFVDFCKLAVVVRPPLTSFMRLMMESESIILYGNEDQLSVTEKAIKDACDIVVALDASRDVPNTEEWPISKVAVLLIDSNKENCMLQFGSVTKGVWSLIEKELTESSINQEISAEKNVGNKRKRNSQEASTYDSDLLQLAYDAVKEVTGIDSSHLEVLETHVTYSATTEKSATLFFMMQCQGSFSINEQVPLKFLVERLQGPLAEKVAYGFWKTTPLVEFHHILPYVEFLSCWLSGKYLCLPSLNGLNPQSTVNCCIKKPMDSPVSKYNGNDLDHYISSGMKVNSYDEIAGRNCDSNNKCRHSYDGNMASPANIFEGTAKDVNVTDSSNERHDIPGSSENNRNLEDLANDCRQPDKGLVSEHSRGLSQETVKIDNTMEKLDNRRNAVDCATNEVNRINLEISDADSDDQKKDFVSSPSRVLSGKSVLEDNLADNKTPETAHFPKKDESRIYLEILDKDNDQRDKDSLSGPSGCDAADCATNEVNRIILEISDTDSDDQKGGFLSSPSRVMSGKSVLEDNVTDNKNPETAHFPIKDESRIYPEILNKDNDQGDKDSLSGPSGVPETMNTTDLTMTCTKSEDTSKKLNSKIRVYHHRRKNNSSTQNDARVREDGGNLMVDTMDFSNSYHTQCSDEKVPGDKCDATTSFNQNGLAETENQLVQFEAKTKDNVDIQSVSASEEEQNALALLYRKRQEQYSRICSMEDTVALYEDNIARIRDGGDIGLARQCINSITSGNYNLLLEHGTEKKDEDQQHGEDSSKSRSDKTRLSEAYLPGKSSCQDLEYTCLKNNWRLPRYLIESSDGKFISYVVVEGKDLKLHSKGGFESKPCKARESAAVQMIAKLQESCE